MRSSLVFALLASGMLCNAGCSRPPSLDPRPSGMGVLKYRGAIPEEGEEEEAFLLPGPVPQVAAARLDRHRLDGPKLVRPSAADCPNPQT